MSDRLPSVEEFLSSWVPNLPQASQIQPADARRWYETAIRVDSERFAWHFQRLLGLGGSDVGEIAAWKLDVPALFRTPEQIVGSKLLSEPISGSNKYMRRGQLVEDDLRETFLSDFGARSRPDLLDAVRQARSARYPWARGNPDDIVEMGARNKKLYLVDYKCPSEAKEVAPLQYACQVHHYDYLLSVADSDKHPRFSGDSPLSVDGLLIVNYDWPGARAVPISVPWSGQILSASLEGGEAVWRHILGEQKISLQPVHVDDCCPIDPDQQQRLSEIERRLVAEKVILDRLESLYSEHRKEFGRVLEDAGRRMKSRVKPALAYMLVRYIASVDQERLENLCRVAGISPQSLRILSEKLDASAMAERLRALGEEPIYEKNYNIARIRELSVKHGLRSPIYETPVLSLARSRRAIAERQPIVAQAGVEVENAVRAVQGSMAGSVHEAAPMAEEGANTATSSNLASARQAVVRPLTVRRGPQRRVG